MELRQLEYFLAILETGSFSAAAEKLYLSQSSLSKQIIKLERELGQPIFTRNSRPVALTDAGRALAQTAPDMVLAWERLRGELAAGGLSLAVTQILAHYGLAERLAHFSRTYPQFNLQISERDNGEIPRLLESGQAELAIFRWDGEEDGRLERLSLCTDELALLVPRSHPLSGGGPVSLRALAGEKFILLGGGTHLQSTIGRCLERAGLTPDVIYEGSNTDTIRALVATNSGISIMLSRIAAHLAEGDARLGVLRFTETSPLEIVLAAAKGVPLSPGAQALWSFLRAGPR